MGELYKLSFPNGKVYIGIAVNGAKGRFLSHRRNALNADQFLYRAWRKHGEPMLKVLAIVEDDLLHETEVRAIASYGTMAPGGYNMTLGGEGVSGYVPSPEHRAKLSAANRLRVCLPETRAKLSAAASNASPEKRAKISAANRNPSPETRAKIGAANRNRSPETRAKLSAAQQGKVASQETRAKMSAAHKGKVLSLEIRAKLSAAQQGQVISPETRAKLSAVASNRSPETRAKLSASAMQREARRRAAKAESGVAA